MTMEHTFPSWREAYDYARQQVESEPYCGWGWATVEKYNGEWLASIA